MDRLEKQYIIRIKSMLFDRFHIKTDDTIDRDYMKILKSTLKHQIKLQNIHFYIIKGVLREYEQIVLSYRLSGVSVMDKPDDLLAGYYDNGCANAVKLLNLFGCDGSVTGNIILIFEKRVPEFSVSFWNKLSVLISKYFNNTVKLLIIKHEKKRYQTLQNVTSQFHSSIDIDDVLKKVLQSLEEIYPHFEYTIFLSNHTSTDHDLPVRPFEYTDDEPALMDAFLTGEYRIKDDLKSRSSLFYFPLKGKQGIYGVLKIRAKTSTVMSEQEIEFISILIQTASNAMENAHLYKQSKQFIRELQLTTMFSKKLNASLGLDDLVRTIATELKKMFSADEIGIVLYENGEMNILDGSTNYLKNDKCHILLQHLFEHFEREEESLYVGDYEGENEGYKSIMVAALREDKENFGFIVVMHKEPYKFSFNAFKLFQSITQHISLAFTNVILREKLEKMVITDYLTGLYTRKYLDEQMLKSMDTDACGAFVLIDIDNFKIINDTYGHQVGDQVLQQISQVIQKHLKAGQIGARWGGEELAIYMPGSSLEEAKELAEQLVYIRFIVIEPNVTISCGVSYWDKEHKESPFTLFKKAGEALYLAKTRGKNQVITSGN